MTPADIRRLEDLRVSLEHASAHLRAMRVRAVMEQIAATKIAPTEIGARGRWNTYFTGTNSVRLHGATVLL